MTTAINNAMGSAKEAFGSATHTAKDLADDAAEAMKDRAGEAAKTTRRVMNFLRGVELNDVLWLVGLRRRRNVVGTLALIGGGVVIGAGAAILLTPASGRDLRRQIAKFFADLGAEAKQDVEQVKQKAGQMAEEAKEKAGEIAGDLKEKVGEAKEKVGEAVNQAAEGAESALNEEAGDDRKGRRRHNQNIQVS